MNLRNTICNYLENKNINYAIMINGEWGSGKTFFIKNSIIKKYDNSLYISLYGLNSIDRLSEKIYLEILKSDVIFNPVSKFFRRLYNKSYIFKILSSSFIFLFELVHLLYDLFFNIIWIATCNFVNIKFKINVSTLTKKDFYALLKMYKDINNYILIFDDLERCCIPVEEVLGFINDFVEHNNMKCIIIANEDEILKVHQDNLELKILTAVNDKIDFSVGKPNGNNSVNKDEKITNEMIGERINYLYNESNKYKAIKEKLIGKEYIFTPNLDDIYDKISFKYKNDDFSLILINIKKSVLNTMSFHNFNNIRTLDFYFDNFYQLFLIVEEYIDNFKINKDYFYLILSSSLINGCILIKKGYKLQLLPNNKRIDYISYEKEDLFFSKMYLTFDFVNEFLLKNYIELSDVEKTICEFADSHFDKLDENDPFNLLNEYYFYETKELDNILKDLLNNIKDGRYNSLLYTSIIKKLAIIENFGFKSKKIKSIIDVIKDNIRNGDKAIIDEYDIVDDENVMINYKNYLKELKQISDDNKAIVDLNELDKILIHDDWGIKFYDYVKNNKDYYLTCKRFLSLFDYKVFEKAFDNTSIKNIYYFKYSLDFIYRFSNLKDCYSQDLNSLKKLKNYLNTHVKKNVNDIMKKNAFDNLINKLNDVIDKLEM